MSGEAFSGVSLADLTVLVMSASSVLMCLKLASFEAEGEVHTPRVSSASKGSFRVISSATVELPAQRCIFAGDLLIESRWGSPLVSHFHLTKHQKHFMNLSSPPVENSSFSQC